MAILNGGHIWHMDSVLAIATESNSDCYRGLLGSLPSAVIFFDEFILQTLVA